ncbi:hypothetical protein Lalb_Chr10g0096501 [Lupinus albus]|uniref:Uncharacterized protein n=1 Tax=Lupinus albus TaxID=3870 RepID=A0A6A4PUJ1_LUPAL|nr:hypothetical protein Lalb_Chr10g0096501 [Lupinus albus]
MKRSDTFDEINAFDFVSDATALGICDAYTLPLTLIASHLDPLCNIPLFF